MFRTGLPPSPVNDARIKQLRDRFEREYQVMRWLCTPYLTKVTFHLCNQTNIFWFRKLRMSISKSMGHLWRRGSMKPNIKLSQRCLEPPKNWIRMVTHFLEKPIMEVYCTSRGQSKIHCECWSTKIVGINCLFVVNTRCYVIRPKLNDE